MSDEQWVWVPKIATDAMLDRGYGQAIECTDDFNVRAACIAEHMWEAMLSAAPSPAISDEMVAKMASAHDAEDGAQRGEPSPWKGYDPNDDGGEFRSCRIAAMRAALAVLTGSETK